MKFKVGDKVRVREDLENDKMYGNYEFIKAMAYLKGEIITIKEILKSGYRIEEDYYMWTDEMLEEVKKEAQQKTFREVIADIKEGEVWESKSKYIRRFTNAIQIYHKENGRSTPSMLMSNNDKFKLQRKEYTFEEAFKAYEEGKEIENVKSNKRMKKENNKHLFTYGENWLDHFEIDTVFSLKDIRGKWYINN